MKHYPPLPPISLSNSSWDDCGPQCAQGKLLCHMLRYAKCLTLHYLICLMHRNCTVQPQGRSGAGSAAPANTIVNRNCTVHPRAGQGPALLLPLIQLLIETVQSSPRAAQGPTLLLPLIQLLIETEQSSPRAGQEPALLLPLIQFLIETDQSKPPDPAGGPGRSRRHTFAY